MKLTNNLKLIITILLVILMLSAGELYKVEKTNDLACIIKTITIFSGISVLLLVLSNKRKP
jgi:hypothetical protein